MLFAIVKPFADSGPAHALSLALGLIEDVRKFSNEFNHFVPVGLFWRHEGQRWHGNYHSAGAKRVPVRAAAILRGGVVMIPVASHLFDGVPVCTAIRSRQETALIRYRRFP